MSKPELEQGLQGLLSLAVNVDWSKVDKDVFQRTVIENPIRAGEEMTKFLQNGARLQVIPASFPVWRIFRTGGLSRDMLLARIGQSASEWTKDVMLQSAFTTSAKARDVAFAASTVAELGFTEPPSTDALRARVRDISAECEAEDGPNIRLGYQDQPHGERLWLVMKPISDSQGDPQVFGVDWVGPGRLLFAGYAGPTARWDLSDRVVFRVRK